MKTKMNRKIKNNGEAKQLSDEEIKTVNAGMKVFVEEEPSWIQSFLKLLFKIRS